MKQLWHYMPDIARIMEQSQLQAEATTSANVGAYGIPVGGALRRVSPSSPGHIVPTNMRNQDGYEHLYDDLDDLLRYYNS